MATTPDSHARHELELLRHVEQDARLSNRRAAQKLGVSVKLAHELLKRLVTKGLLHVNVIHSRRWDYFLTPAGLAEKTRLTLEFLDFSLHFYREARKRSAQLCRDLAAAGQRNVAFLGTGELAEITWLGVQEWGLDLRAVYAAAADHHPPSFLGHPVSPPGELRNDRNDAIIVCLYDPRHPLGGRFLPPAIAPSPKLRWIFAAAPAQ
ncbi:MAG: winged helix-turn-helix transcriptional regulator [Lentisphaeria bacterium]|jgi:hypothetical protein